MFSGFITSEKYRKTEQGPLYQPTRFEIRNLFVAFSSLWCFLQTSVAKYWCLFSACRWLYLFPELKIWENWFQDILEGAEVKSQPLLSCKMWKNRKTLRSGQGLSKNISHLGVRDIKSPPSFRPPHRAPPIGVQRGKGLGGQGTPQE